MSNILYVSCHSVLEYDEIKILKELGHHIFSCGSYIEPLKPTENLRESIELYQNKDWLNIFHKTNCKMLPNGMWVFSREFLNIFDTVIFMHSYQSLLNSIRMLSGKKIYWRTIGQSNSLIEKSVSKIKNDIKIIRYSPYEENIPGYCGSDHLVRFYKNKNDYKPRNKEVDKICIFYNSFNQRINHFNYYHYQSNIAKIPHDIFGRNNVEGNFLGEKSYMEQVDIYSKYAASYVINTSPAQYTLSFIESLAAEIPLIIDPSDSNLDERFSILENNKIFYNTSFNDESVSKEKVEIQNRVFKNNFDKNLIKKNWNNILY